MVAGAQVFDCCISTGHTRLLLIAVDDGFTNLNNNMNMQREERGKEKKKEKLVKIPSVLKKKKKKTKKKVKKKESKNAQIRIFVCAPEDKTDPAWRDRESTCSLQTQGEEAIQPS